MTEKKVYSDEKMKDWIEQCKKVGTSSEPACFVPVLCVDRAEEGAMIQQLLDERDAVLKDLKALEADIEHVQEPGVDTAGWLDIVDTKRSEKYGESGSS